LGKRVTDNTKSRPRVCFHKKIVKNEYLNDIAGLYQEITVKRQQVHTGETLLHSQINEQRGAHNKQDPPNER
jgi:hypothetical protein